MGGTALAQGKLFALREAIAKIEGRPLSAGLEPEPDAGCAEVDAAGGFVGAEEASGLESLLPDGFPVGAMIELRGGQLRDAGAVSGFGLGLCLACLPAQPEKRILWIGESFVAREAGLPHAAGLVDYGCRPGELVYAMPRRVEEALWLADAALSCGAFAAVMLEVNGNPRGFGLTESRRLSLKARSTGGFLLLLRQGGEEEASSASLRLRIEPAPAAARILSDGTMLGGSIGNSVFRLVPEKSRLGASRELTLEWNKDDRLFYPATFAHTGQHRPERSAYPGALVSQAFDRSAGASPLGTVVAFDRAS
ncbi:ImuA family protein [Rhizobium sp. CAU 1783]